MSNAAARHPFVATKLRPPSHTAALVDRPRLMDVLQQVTDRKVTLIHGPAGFGKTTLAVQWHDRLAERGVTVAWLAVDAVDNNLARFLTYVVEAIRTVEPEVGAGLAGLIESTAGVAADLVLSELLSELCLHDRQIVLFLDDFHLVTDAAIHQALDLLVSRIPPNFHLVITSRARGGLSLARLKVENTLLEINVSDLRFTIEESDSFLDRVKTQALSEADIHALWRSTEGWIAALQLASISLRRSNDRAPLLAWANGAPSDVGEYLLENVMSALPVRTVDFMLKTSVLGRLSPGLCLAVTGEPDSAELLDILDRQELFLFPLDDERQWFRYHHLFALFLQRRLEQKFPAQVRALHFAAAEWFSAQEQTEEAVGHAMAAGDAGRAVALVEKDAMSLMQKSYMATLLGLVKRLPRALLFDQPVLQCAIAWASCLTHRPMEALESLSHVHQSAQRMKDLDAALLHGEADVIQACIDVYADRLDNLQRLVQPCLDDSQRYPPWVVGVAANILSYRFIHSDETARVGPLQAWARAYQDRAEGCFSSVYGRCFSGLAAYRCADLTAARQHFSYALELANVKAGQQSNAARLAGGLLGHLMYEQNQLEDAGRLLDESRFLGVEGGVADFYIATYVASARLASLRSGSAEAMAILAEGEGIARQLKLDRFAASIVGERVRMHLLKADVAGARNTLADSADHLDSAPSAQSGIEAQIWEELQLAKARLLSAQGNHKEALAVLSELSGRAGKSGRLYLQSRLAVVCAMVLDAAGRRDEAQDLLGRTVRDGMQLGLVRTFLDEGPAAISIIERLGAQASERTSVFGSAAQRLMDAARSEGIVCGNGRHGSSTKQGQRRSVDDTLKDREINVLKLLDQGLSNKEIARTLFISVETVKWYLKSIFAKLGSTRRGQAIAEARRLRLFEH